MEKILPRLEEWRDLNIIGDDETRRAAIGEVEDEGCIEFEAATPAYYKSEKNALLLLGWLHARGVPATFWNLAIAFRVLSEEGQLETAPPVAEPMADKWTSVTLSRTDALAEYVPSDEEAAQLEKLADDPSLSDQQRKTRIRKLALLAGQQRREMSNLPQYLGQRVVI